MHLLLIFDDNIMSQKHLGAILDEVFIFAEYSRMILSMCKYWSFTQFLKPFQNALITIQKVFIGPHIDYGDVFYDQTCDYSSSDT